MVEGTGRGGEKGWGKGVVVKRESGEEAGGRCISREEDAFFFFFFGKQP